MLNRYSTWKRKKTTVFSSNHLRSCLTSDKGVFGYIHLKYSKGLLSKLWQISPEILYVYKVGYL